jgi:predicted nucleic acid-binding protein
MGLSAPNLLEYEVTNAVVQAHRRGRLDGEQVERILRSFALLEIALRPIGWAQILPFAQRFERSAYDAAYLALAESMGERLITGDLRMYNAVRHSLDWVLWVGDYPAGVR